MSSEDQNNKEALLVADAMANQQQESKIKS